MPMVLHFVWVFDCGKPAISGPQGTTSEVLVSTVGFWLADSGRERRPFGGPKLQELGAD